MRHPDTVTPLMLARRLPALARRLPRLLTGLPRLAHARVTGRTGLGWAVEQAAARNPNGHAVRYQDTALDYTDFNRWANRIAHFYHAQGLRRGDVVAVLLENRPEFLAVLTGLAKLGVIAALLNTSQTGRVLTHSINLVKPKRIIVGEELRPVLDAIRADIACPADGLHWLADAYTWQAPGVAPAGYLNLAAASAGCPAANPATTRTVTDADGLVYIYTSGTTGLPKAAILSHGRWMKVYLGMGAVLGLERSDVLYCPLPLYHGTALVACWTGVLEAGATIALRRKFSAREFWNDCRRFDATAFGYVGELCRYLIDQPASASDRRHRVRKMIGNGLRPTIWNDFKQRFGIAEVLEFYGSSEGNIGFSNVFNLDNTVGFCPLPYAVVAWDPEREQPVRAANGRLRKVGRGEVGLLIGRITTHTAFEGYTDPARNAACILTDVFTSGDRYFNTGDLVRDLGCRHAQFVDRTGDTFRWKGQNVSTTEVENVIAGLDGLQAVVYGVEIPGTNGRAGMAAVVAGAGGLDLAALHAHLVRELPGYALPLFIRAIRQVDTTATFKPQKQGFKQAGFDPGRVGADKVYVLLPGGAGYVPLTAEVHERVGAGAYRF